MVTDDTEIEWQPAELLKPQGHSRYALIVLNQPLDNEQLLEAVWKKAELRIAADGGADRIHTATSEPAIAKLINDTKIDAVVGDLDSVSPAALQRARNNGTTVSKDGDQYSTDFTKAYKYIREHCVPLPCDVVVLGGLGGRVDQALATLNHLYIFQESYDGGMVYLVSGEAVTFVLKKGRHRIRVKDGDGGVLGRNIGIIPKAPCHITTQGLEWDVERWRTEWGGQISTSNYVREEWVLLETDGDVLFTIDFCLKNESSR